MSQLSTYTEAAEISDLIGTIGGGVSRTYIPEYQQFTAPEDGDQKFLHFDFKNGSTGHNVGLIRSLIANSPTRWPIMLATEVERGRKVSVNQVPIGFPNIPGVSQAQVDIPVDLSRQITPGRWASTPYGTSLPKHTTWEHKSTGNKYIKVVSDGSEGMFGPSEWWVLL